MGSSKKSPTSAKAASACKKAKSACLKKSKGANAAQAKERHNNKKTLKEQSQKCQMDRDTDMLVEQEDESVRERHLCGKHHSTPCPHTSALTLASCLEANLAVLEELKAAKAELMQTKAALEKRKAPARKKCIIPTPPNKLDINIKKIHCYIKVKDSRWLTITVSCPSSQFRLKDHNYLL